MLNVYVEVRNWERSGKNARRRMTVWIREKKEVDRAWERRTRSASTRVRCSALRDWEVRKALLAGLEETRRPDLLMSVIVFQDWGDVGS